MPTMPKTTSTKKPESDQSEREPPIVSFNVPLAVELHASPCIRASR
jgi:hypothetical protein